MTLLMTQTVHMEWKMGTGSEPEQMPNLWEMSPARCLSPFSTGQFVVPALAGFLAMAPLAEADTTNTGDTGAPWKKGTGTEPGELPPGLASTRARSQSPFSTPRLQILGT